MVLICLLTLTFIDAEAQRAKQLSLMVIPSDNHLKRLDCLQEVDAQGEAAYNREYQKAFINDVDLEFAVSGIQSRFAGRGYPLLDLQQSLKDMAAEKLVGKLEGEDKDILTQVLNYSRPDIILELTYTLQDKGFNTLAFILNAKDAYTKKSIFSITNPSEEGAESVGKSIGELIADQVELNMHEFIRRFAEHKNKMSADGREIILKVVSTNNAIDDFRDAEFGASGETWNDWLLDWIEQIEKPGGEGSRNIVDAPKIQKFSVHIDLFDAKGKAISATYFARQLVKQIKMVSGLKATRSSKGIGEATVFVKP